jgi:ferredoxin
MQMPRTVTLVAEIIEEKCTGCNTCVKVCPTIAMSLRDRRPGEPGKGKKIAVVDPKACYNVQNCFEICPNEAIVMRELAEPFTVETDVSLVDPAEIAALSAKAGFTPAIAICGCTETTVGEIAAAILLGANTPEKVSLATGARTGCTEICAHGVLKLLWAAGHADPPPAVDGGWQHYDICGTLWEHVGPDGKVEDRITGGFPTYPVQREITELAEIRSILQKVEEDTPPKSC